MRAKARRLGSLGNGVLQFAVEEGDDATGGFQPEGSELGKGRQPYVGARCEILWVDGA